MKFVENYFQKAEKYSTLRFILELTILAFLTKIIFIIFGGIFLTILGVSIEPDISFEQELLKAGPIFLTILIILFASFETLTGQWFMIWLVSHFTRNIWTKVLVSAAVFASLHITPMLIISSFPIGVILAFSFIIKRKISRWHTFWVTTAIHTLHNLVVEGFIFFGLVS